MSPATIRSFAAGAWLSRPDGTRDIADKYTGELVTTVEVVGRAAVTDAVSAAVDALDAIRLTQAERADVLELASTLVDQRRDELIDCVITDTGFTLADARREVDRTVQTLQISAEETRRLVGELLPLSGTAGQEGRIAYSHFGPLGVVCAITPFNSPLNTVAHKVAPALGAGNAVILKPALLTPRSADAFLRTLLDAGLPEPLITVLYGAGSTVGQWLAEDPRPAFYAFTGSTAVGERLHRTVGMRRTQLEMGSLSSTIICADADLDRAASLAAASAFRKSGQVCTSVQRLYVHRDVADEVGARIAASLKGRQAGDPRDPEVHVGPLITPDDAERVHGWICEAADHGAEVVIGGTRQGNVVSPTVLASVPTSSTIMNSEVFGPVVLLKEFEQLQDAIDDANATPYGLAAGIFTNDIEAALTAADQLEVGSVHINETSNNRADAMPFFGIKKSGFGGAEGPRYAIREMSQERVVTMRRP